MRIKFVVRFALMGCITLLLGSTPGGSRFPAGDVPDVAPGALPRDRAPADEVGVALEEGEVGDGLLGPGGEGGPRDPNAWMDERFRLLDRDGDGFLSYEEMTENLKAEKDKWDVNKDGRIDLMEWREYVKAFLEQQRRSAADSDDRARPRGQPARASSRGRREPG